MRICGSCQISDGERRRVQLCMGLMTEWSVLLLDEVGFVLCPWLAVYGGLVFGPPPSWTKPMRPRAPSRTLNRQSQRLYGIDISADECKGDCRLGCTCPLRPHRLSHRRVGEPKGNDRL
jgi:hypothetical protein